MIIMQKTGASKRDVCESVYLHRDMLYCVIITMLLQIACYTGGDDMANPKIDYNNQKTYTIADVNCVGPCSDTSVRTGFDAGSSAPATYNNTNTIFVASNGSDANNGEYATPVLTINYAVSLLAGAIVNIMVLTDDVDIDGTVVNEIPTGTSIVALNGKTPTLKWNGVYIEPNVMPASKAYLLPNGIFYSLDYKSADFGTTWSASALPSGSALGLNQFSSNRRILIHNGQRIYTTDDATTYTERYNTTGAGFLTGSPFVIAPNGYAYISKNTTGLTHYRSTDNGVNWTAITTTVAIIIWYADFTGLYAIGTTATTYYKSADNGVTWVVLSDEDKINEINKYSANLYDKYRLYRLSGNGNIQTSNDNGYRYKTLYTHGKYNFQYIMWDRHNESLYYADDEDDSTLKKYTQIMFPLVNNDFTIDGFYLDGYEGRAFSIISGLLSNTGVTVRYCKFQDFYYSPIQNVDYDTLTVYRSVVAGGKKGV